MTATTDTFNLALVKTFDYLALEITPWNGNNWPDSPCEECVLCDRPVRTDRPHHVVEMADGGSLLVSDVADEHRAALESDGGYMGCHVIGPSCRKKLPKGFAWKVQGN